MAKILYFSTHESLEYDDITLFQELGHTVFSLGIYCPANPGLPSFRSGIPYDEKILPLVDAFRSSKCEAEFLDLGATVLSEEFINLFDVVISIQDIGFIAKYWDIIHPRPLIWRTVGQAIDHFDAPMADYRRRGLKVVRWCAREARAKDYIGHDAIIRAYKDPWAYGPWQGSESKIITFCNHYLQRYPIELGVFERVVKDFDYAIGGIGNDDVPKSTGLVDLKVMQKLLRSARAYFYCHGSVVPYTLNFIEAWMTGIPLVALHRSVEIANIDMQYNEVNEFISHGHNGFLVRSEGQAKELLGDLMHSDDLCFRVGRAGRDSAIRLFGKETIGAQWQRLFVLLGLT